MFQKIKQKESNNPSVSSGLSWAHTDGVLMIVKVMQVAVGEWHKHFVAAIVMITVSSVGLIHCIIGGTTELVFLVLFPEHLQTLGM